MFLSVKFKKIVDSSYHIGTETLKKVSEVKYLGVTLSADLTFNHHIDNTVKKAVSVLNLLHRNLRNAPPSVKKAAYFSLVRPILEYASVAWDPHQEYLIQKLEAIQNRGARFILSNYTWGASVTEMKSSIGLEPLRERRRKHRLKLLYCIYNNLTGIMKEKYLQTPHYVSQRRDHINKIREIKCRTNYKKFSFFPFTISQWNELAADIVSNSVETFTRVLSEL